MHQLAPAPLRTVLALFTHTAPHMVIQRGINEHSPLYGAVSLPPVPRFCERSVFPHSAYHVWPPSLQRHYPPSPVLLGHPTPCATFAFLPLRLSGILPLREEGTGSPGLPHNHNVGHAMVSDPEEADITLPIAIISVLTSAPPTASSFPSRHLRGSFPSTLRLTACLLAVLSLKLYVTTQPPRTRYPVAGLPSGAGFAPAGLRDLARPHWSRDPYVIYPLSYRFSMSLKKSDIISDRWQPDNTSEKE